MIVQGASQTIETSIIHPDRYGIFISLYLIAGLILTMGVAWELHLFSVALVGAFLFFLTPIIFQNRFRNAFSEKAIMHFFPDHLEVEILDPKTGTLHKRQEFKFDEMATYTEMKSSKDNSTYIKIRFLGRSTVKYTIPGKSEGETANEVALVLAKYIHAFNEKQDAAHKIMFIPPILASRTAVYYLVALIALLVFGVFWQLVYRPHSIFLYALIPGALFSLLVLYQRKKDIDLSKKNQ